MNVCESGDAGEMTARRTLYVNNTTLMMYLKIATNFTSLMAHLPTNDWNAHTWGTYFEALLSMSKDPEATVQYLIAWADSVASDIVEDIKQGRVTEEEEIERKVEGSVEAHLGVHKGVLTDVRWVSHSGKVHIDRFYSCCGLHQENRRKCGKYQWSNPNSFHTGTLQLHSSKRQPGGRYPTGTPVDHIARCKEPVWSCCRCSASSEGCRVVHRNLVQY